VRTLALAELRRATAMVAQEPVLFAGTLRDNIAYGKDGATDAADRAGRARRQRPRLHHELPRRLRTVIGERGVKLSGGQKQRIAIARALLVDPRVLILDEATSNLDAESEAQVQEALARLMRGRTTLVVAHRLSTVRDADRIVVIHGGKVAEQRPPRRADGRRRPVQAAGRAPGLRRGARAVIATVRIGGVPRAGGGRRSTPRWCWCCTASPTCRTPSRR
jgi:ATP-binding cassette subfamily B protein